MAWPALAVLVAIATALGAAFPLSAALGGAVDGRVVGRVLTRLVLDLAAGAVLGTHAAVLLVLPRDDPRRGRLLDLAAGAAAVWTVAAGTTAFLLYLGDAPAVSAPGFGPGFVAFVADVEIGRAWLIATIGAAVLTAALVAVRSSAGVAALGPLAALALLPVALQCAMSGESLAVERTTVTAEFVQLVGLGTWIGIAGLVAAVGVAPAVLRRVAGLLAAIGLLVLLGAAIAAAQQVDGTVSPAPVVLDLALTAVAVAVAVAVPVLLRARPAAALLRIELLVLGALAGFTAVTSVIRSSDLQVPPRVAPAEILTGAPLPPAPSPARLALGWQPDAVWLVICAVLLVGYLAGVAALRRRGDRWPGARVIAWAGGVVLLGWLTSGGPAVYQEVLVSAHLAQHAALLLPVPILLAMGAPVRLLQRIGPQDDGTGAVRTWIVALLRSAPVRGLARPVPALLLAVVGLLALYGTGLLRWSVTDPVGAEEGILQCLLTGCLLVSALCAAPVARRTAAAWVVVLLVVEAVGAALLAAGTGLLLPEWFGAMGWGTDALLDQRAGAVLAGGITVVSTGVLLILVLRRRDDVPRAARRPVARRVQEEVPA
jgi:putative copper resistance protein D